MLLWRTSLPVDHQAPGLDQRLWSALSSLAGNDSSFVSDCDLHRGNSFMSDTDGLRYSKIPLNNRLR